MYIKLVKRRYQTKTGTKESEVYTAIIRFGRHSEFSRSTGKTTQREAMQWARGEADRIRIEVLPKKLAENITVNQLFSVWWSDYARHQRSADTMKQRSKLLFEIINGETLVRDITDDFVARLVVDLFEGDKGDRSPATVNRYVDILKASLRIGKKKWKDKSDQFQVIDWGEHSQREPRERVVFLSETEVRDLIQASLPHENIALAVAWSVLTGCRLNETASLTWNKVFIEGRYCTVLAKGGFDRHVILSPNAIKVLGSLAKQEDSHLVFDLKNRRKIWESARKSIGKPELRWHDLRHVNATWLRQYGKLDLKAVGKSLGHSSISSTDRYAHVANDELQTANDALPDVMRAFEVQESKHKEGANVGCNNL